jgi:hypothetical protein
MIATFQGGTTNSPVPGIFSAKITCKIQVSPADVLNHQPRTCLMLMSQKTFSIAALNTSILVSLFQKFEKLVVPQLPVFATKVRGFRQLIHHHDHRHLLHLTHSPVRRSPQNLPLFVVAILLMLNFGLCPESSSSAGAPQPERLFHVCLIPLHDRCPRQL